MAKQECGFLGGFTGRLGTQVGRYSHGVYSTIPYHYKNPMEKGMTDQQALQQARFKAVGELIPALLNSINVGFKKKSQSSRPWLSPSNVFMEVNLDRAAVGTDPESVSIDYSKLKISEGKTPDVTFGSANFEEAKTVTVSFQSNSEVPGANDDDDVFIQIYCPSTKLGILSAPAKRSVKSASVTCPGTWSGLEVHVFGYVVNEKGICSNSLYIGSGTLA